MNKILLLHIVFFIHATFAFAQTLEEKQWIVNGNNFFLQKEYDKARVEYSKVLVQTPGSVKANFNLGNAFYELKQFDKAITHFNKAAKSTDQKLTKAQAYHNLGNTFMQKKAYEKAVEAYKNALRNNPKDNETRYNFALAKKLLENQQEKNQNPPDLPKPSDYAKEMKAKADSISEKGKFGDALKLMNQALTKDSTVMHFKTYMDKLNEIIILDTIRNK